MYYTIYEITNTINDKVYIGKHQTENINDSYMGSGKLLRRAQIKYGIENFNKKILYVFDNEKDMNAKEAELVSREFCLREDTYNICSGGKGGFSYVNNLGINNVNKDRAEIYKRVSSSLSGRIRPDISNALKKQYEAGTRRIVVTPQYGNNYAKKKIRCLNTGIIYNSVKDAAQILGVTPSCITRHKREGKYEKVT